MLRYLTIICLILVPLAGCRQPAGTPTAGVFGGTPAYGSSTSQLQANTPEQYRQFTALAEQMQALNTKLGAFDQDNQALLTDVAGLKQKLQVSNDYNNQLRQQLADNANQFQQIVRAKQQAEQQLAVVENKLKQLGPIAGEGQLASSTGGAPTRLVGSATLRANNSLMGRLSSIQIAGGSARMDGDVIRIEFPSDRIFTLGTYKVDPTQSGTLGNLVTTIRQQFPKQIIGIEAHWDGTPLNPPTTTHHQLTATQALSIFNTLQQLGLPSEQMFTMALGSNRPRHPKGLANGVSPNRRIEVVIYPETFGDK